MIPAAITAALCLPATVAGWYAGPMLAKRCQQRRLQARCAATRTLVLTYDDGPSAELTPRLLELLGARGVRATFFLAGARAVEHPRVADRIVKEGHEVGCHGDEHLNAWRTWPWRTVSDVTTGYRKLSPWVPQDGLYRPPFGKMTPLTWAALRRRRAPIGWWTIAGGDVVAEPPDVSTAARRAARAGGGVVLLHDFDRGSERAEFVLKATELVLDAAKEHGWSVQTLGQLTRNGQGNAR
ncbi:MAG: polysaccharide deacetylase family protein [Planctomycetota bacterium]|jgi:peptidoglycan/xylan/chitin deacetylase (PgdA/CDA1 family)